MKLYFRILKMVKPYWKTLTVGILASLMFVLFNSASVWLTASFVNVLFPKTQTVEQQSDSRKEVVEPTIPVKLNANDKLKALTNKLILRDEPVKTLRMLCLTIFLTFILKNIFFYIKNVCISWVQLKAVRDLRNRLYEHLHNLSLSFFQRKRGGEISSIVLNDVSTVRNSLSVSFDKLLVEPINILTFMTLLFIISWKLSLFAVIILPLTFIAISKIGQSVRRKSIRTSKQIAGIMAILDETLHGIRVIKAFSMENFEKMRFFRETEKYFQLLFKRRKLKIVSTPINEFFSVIIGISLLWFGGSHVLAGSGIEAEDFVRFIIMLFALMTPIKSLNNVNTDIQEAIASTIRIYSILDEKPDVVEKSNAQVLDGFHREIRYDHVRFIYPQTSHEVLSDVNMTIRKGEIVAIVGHSGAGKSTLADLLPRFYDPVGGSVQIDGIDIRDITFSSLRSLMGIVTQQTILFNDTIFNNIAYGLGDTDPEKVIAAADAANALEFINLFPDKFETMIGDKGLRLSGGERQRLAIARALLKNPPILILDEATSSLDSESEQKVQAAIEQLMKDRTVLVIAHRLSTIQNANKIIVLEKRKIYETGTHDELVKKEDSLYRYFYETQFVNHQTNHLHD
ncbi:MAG: ABC transporter ATP-binding protein [Candidatus Marinimicrobia bacterium CG08_land_8_20_14_0_20_45_22]|nr:MAG: ABC transporter ATP-binding protein [Candidatus Marinimicrobia bacterium CG08_land_8_20_14_0_20_45_22]